MSTALLTALGIDLALVAALVVGLSSASARLGPKRRLNGDKGMAYETGMVPFAPALERMAVSYQRYAVLFVLFDIDLSFVAPWVLLRGRLSLGPMLVMTGFMGLVALTLAYVWRKGVLCCD